MFRLCRSAITASALLLSLLLTGSAFAGAIYTTDNTGTIVNANTQYGTPADVYLSGGPQNTTASGPADGTYYFQVTDPSGKTLLSTDNAVCRQLTVTGGRVVGASPASGACAHLDGTPNPANGATPVQLAPFGPTPNAGNVYKAWMIPTSKATIGSDPKILTFAHKNAKTDNFKIPVFTPPPAGSCQPSSSLSVLVTGTNVTSYVPKGSWSFGVSGVSVVNVEGSSITPTLIPTTNVVNSCASNSITGTTVCTANNTDVYLLSGTTLGSTLTSSGSGTILFSGGTCTNCGVAMDAIHNKAVIGLSLAGVGGFQFLDLSTSTFEPAFASMSPTGFLANISEDPLLDPIRNLLLSASELNNYEIIDYTTSTTPLFFENPIPNPGFEADSSGEDCTTGIALAPYEFTDPSQVYIADLTQATFTAGSPGTWTTTGSQIQTLTESSLAAGASGLAVAQGPQHKGVVTGEFGGDAVTAIQLPTTSGSGTPAITDWVTCSIGGGFSNGFDPHTVTAYESPNSGHAIALLADGGTSQLAVVDLTNMLDTIIVPRTVGGHGCASGTLPATVVSFVAVP